VVNFASCIPTVRGSCDLLGDLEQQPEATVTSAFVMLLGSPAAMEAAAAREATAAPGRSTRLPDLDPTGGLAGALRAGPDSVHLVRPDGHLAAVLPRFERGTWPPPAPRRGQRKWACLP
jgi:hypothetical protein